MGQVITLTEMNAYVKRHSEHKAKGTLTQERVTHRFSTRELKKLDLTQPHIDVIMGADEKGRERAIITDGIIALQRSTCC